MEPRVEPEELVPALLQATSTLSKQFVDGCGNPNCDNRFCHSGNPDISPTLEQVGLCKPGSLKPDACWIPHRALTLGNTELDFLVKLSKTASFDSAEAPPVWLDLAKLHAWAKPLTKADLKEALLQSPALLLANPRCFPSEVLTIASDDPKYPDVPNWFGISSVIELIAGRPDGPRILAEGATRLAHRLETEEPLFIPGLHFLGQLLAYSHRKPDSPGEPDYWAVLWTDLVPVVRKFLSLVDKIPPEREFAGLWWAGLFQMPAGLLGRMILLQHSFLFTEMPQILDLDAVPLAVQHCLSFLSQLSASNSELQKVPSSLFQCSNILNDRVDLKADYQRLRNGVGEFHFVTYSFLFDSATKAGLMRVASFLEMVSQVQQAFFHAAFRQLHSPNAISAIPSSVHLLFDVRRENLMEDTETLLDLMHPSSLRKPLKLQFEGEEGLDQGGLQKEYFQLLLRELFNEPLWSRNAADTRLLWFGQARPDHYEFVGKVIGLAVYNGVIVDLPFPPIFYRLLISPQTLRLADLQLLNTTLAQNMQKLLEFEGDVEAAFSLDWTFAVEWEGKVAVLPLAADSERPVTNANRAAYAEAYTEFAILRSVEPAWDAFLAGFTSVMSLGPLRLLYRDHAEVEALICGLREVDLAALARAADYEGYTAQSQVIAWFWEVVNTFELEERKALLAFVTGSDRVPVQGLDSVAFVVQRDGPDTNRLPTSRTCFSILLLPEYSSKAKLENRLRLALSNSQGFGLI